MKIIRKFLLLSLSALLLAGCSQSQKTEIKEVVTKELDLLKNLDSATTQKYISYQELFPDTTDTSDLSPEIKEVFSLFFKDFNYKILEIQIDPETQSADVTIRLTTIDSRTLARDFKKSFLQQAILYSADSTTRKDKPEVSSLEGHYLLLNQLLKENTYKPTETNCTMHLTYADDQWRIIRNQTLENQLVGGLLTYLSDPDLLTPEETLEVYLNTIKNMDTETLADYFGISSLLHTDDPARDQLAQALLEQIHKHFDYRIGSSDTDSYTSTINVTLITFDRDSLMEQYQKDLKEYMSTADAVIDGEEGRINKSHSLLLNAIQNNQECKESEVTLSMSNDGYSWRLEDNSLIANTIFSFLSDDSILSDSSSQSEPSECEEEITENGSYEESCSEEWES